MGDDIFTGSNHQGINLKNIQTTQSISKNNPIKKLGGRSKCFSKEDNTVKNHMKRCSILLSQKRKPKLQWGVISHWSECPLSKHLQTINAGVHAKSLQLCPTLCDPVDCSPPSSSVHGILRARILEWVAISQRWRGCGEMGILLHCWWEYKLVLPLWRTVWNFLKNLTMELPHDPATPLLGLDLGKIIKFKTFSSFQFSRSVVSNSLQSHEPQHARPPRIYPNPGASSRWCYPAISSSVIPFSCPQYLPASGSFPMSQLFASDGQSIGVSASTSVPPMNTQDWSPLGWAGWISLQSKGLSRVFSNTTVQKQQFSGTQLSL